MPLLVMYICFRILWTFIILLSPYVIRSWYTFHFFVVYYLKDIFVIDSENAAKIIQSHFRRSVEQCRYMRMKCTASFLQAVIRAWLTRKKSLIQMPNQREAQGSLNCMCYCVLCVSSLVIHIDCFSNSLNL